MATAPKPKKRLKLPTGELPKRLSKAAQDISMNSSREGKQFQMTPSASAAAAGMYRDIKKKVGGMSGNLDTQAKLKKAAALAKAKKKK